MTERSLDWRAHAEIMQCPRCQAGLQPQEQALRCLGCGQQFEIGDGIPRLFWPNEWDASQTDVTETVKSFYEETPFPNYEEFDSVASLAAKARRGLFARMLDEQVPPATRILECGCGTGQLSNFLSIANRTVFASDICLNSLRLGQDFARRHELERAHFVQMNLFRPAFKPESFHLVVSNGVLHHTSDPFLAFRSIAGLVRPGGYLLVGLYHRYGRLITDFRRLLFRLSGDRFQSLDPNLRQRSEASARRKAWFADQYKHPHESKHTIGETLRWFPEAGLRFVRSVPTTRPFRPYLERDNLFAPEAPGNPLERAITELGMAFKGSREGGFFVVIGQKPVLPRSA